MPINTRDKVPPHCWVYLEGWNRKDNWEYIRDTYNTLRLDELTVEEFWVLFKHATESDIAALVL